MESKSTYRTIAYQSEGLYKEKGSKFIGYVKSCFDVDEAKVQLEEWRKENHQARHLCYAYRFGVDQDVFRSNDDGEPNNSAGAPILGQIQSYDLSNVLIGVVRYYGGTKLGVGGLINAYRSAAKEAIEAGTIVVKEVFEWIDITFSYADMPIVMRLVKNNSLIIHHQLFELNCALTIGLSLDKKETIRSTLLELSSMKINIKGIY